MLARSTTTVIICATTKYVAPGERCSCGTQSEHPQNQTVVFLIVLEQKRSLGTTYCRGLLALIGLVGHRTHFTARSGTENIILFHDCSMY